MALETSCRLVQARMPPEQPHGSSGGIAVSTSPYSPKRRWGGAGQQAVVLVIVAVLGCPIWFLIRLSFRRSGLFQLMAHKGAWAGLSTTSRRR